MLNLHRWKPERFSCYRHLKSWMYLLGSTCMWMANNIVVARVLGIWTSSINWLNTIPSVLRLYLFPHFYDLNKMIWHLIPLKIYFGNLFWRKFQPCMSVVIKPPAICFIKTLCKNFRNSQGKKYVGCVSFFNICSLIIRYLFLFVFYYLEIYYG